MDMKKSKNSIGIIDADLISEPKTVHAFPNLACMKLSNYHKHMGDNVKHLLSYKNLDRYDTVYISKVFINSKIPEVNIFFEVPILLKPNVIYGGTGFFFDKAEPLSDDIEHCKPDYDFYNEWVEIEKGRKLKRVRFEYYTDYSIGFMTRGCFRKCLFCVNKRYNKVFFHSHLSEFFDETKRAISLWDDNILGYSKWKDVFDELIDTGKPFEFKQGMDIRLMTKEKAKCITNCKYKGDYIFAFDNIEDKNIIIEKIKLWRDYVNPKRRTKLYVFCGFDKNNLYDESFWKQDIENMFERIKILMQFGCVPYIMRYNECIGPYKDVYQTAKTWCNFVPSYMKKSFRMYCIGQGKAGRNPEINSMKKIEKLYPDIAKKYFDLRREDIILNKDWT
jgi:hypothetical protein